MHAYFILNTTVKIGARSTQLFLFYSLIYNTLYQCSTFSLVIKKQRKGLKECFIFPFIFQCHHFNVNSWLIHRSYRSRKGTPLPLPMWSQVWFKWFKWKARPFSGGLSTLSLGSRCETPRTNSDLLTPYWPCSQWCSVLSSQAHATCSKYYVRLVTDPRHLPTLFTYVLHDLIRLHLQNTRSNMKYKEFYDSNNRALNQVQTPLNAGTCANAEVALMKPAWNTAVPISTTWA